jgi:hypothetical protein
MWDWGGRYVTGTRRGSSLKEARGGGLATDMHVDGAAREAYEWQQQAWAKSDGRRESAGRDSS